MDLNRANSWQLFGYFLAFFIFSFVVYLLLQFFNKLPLGWDYFNIVSILAVLIYLGRGIKYWTDGF